MAILVTVGEWLGPGRSMTAAERAATRVLERTFSVYSEESLALTIDDLHKYEEAFNARYALAVNFTVLSVSEIQGLSKERLDKARIGSLDDLLANAKRFTAEGKELAASSTRKGEH